jgi:hypothetical protein
MSKLQGGPHYASHLFFLGIEVSGAVSALVARAPFGDRSFLEN